MLECQRMLFRSRFLLICVMFKLADLHVCMVSGILFVVTPGVTLRQKLLTINWDIPDISVQYISVYWITGYIQI